VDSYGSAERGMAEDEGLSCLPRAFPSVEKGYEVSNYTRGANFEYRVKKHFEGLGFEVYRSAGSHSPADLIALKRKFRPLLIQCKYGKGGIRPSELETLVGAARKTHSLGVVVRARPRQPLQIALVYTPPRQSAPEIGQ
jgi:hypothetical protein